MKSSMLLLTLAFALISSISSENLYQNSEDLSIAESQQQESSYVSIADLKSSATGYHDGGNDFNSRYGHKGSNGYHNDLSYYGNKNGDYGSGLKHKYNDKGGKHFNRHDVKSGFYGDHVSGAKGINDHAIGSKGQHNKGSSNKGFKNIYHKEEYGVNKKYYDDNDFKNYHSNHDDFDKYFSGYKGVNNKGGSHKGDQQHSVYGNKGSNDKEQFYDSYSGKKGSHGNKADFGHDSSYGKKGGNYGSFGHNVGHDLHGHRGLYNDFHGVRQHHGWKPVHNLHGRYNRQHLGENHRVYGNGFGRGFGQNNFNGGYGHQNNNGAGYGKKTFRHRNNLGLVEYISDHRGAFDHDGYGHRRGFGNDGYGNRHNHGLRHGGYGFATGHNNFNMKY